MARGASRPEVRARIALTRTYGRRASQCILAGTLAGTLSWSPGCKSDQGYGSNLPPAGVTNPAPLPDAWLEDRITQVTVPQADVLWTVDNSGSMEDEQAAIAQNAQPFIDFFDGSGIDFHIGVVSTDIDNPGGGQLRIVAGQKFITPDTLDPTVVFGAMVRMGTGGSGEEKGIGATFTALEVLRDTFNADFYRDEAALHTIVISDEDDQTPGPLDEFIGWYDGLKPAHDQRTFSSIVSFVPTIDGAERGTTYMEVSDAIGGIVWDITDEDWAEVLHQLGLQAAGLKQAFYLSHLPDPDTITVSIDDQGAIQAPGPWTYDWSANSIAFEGDYYPPALSVVVIRYQARAASRGGQSTGSAD